MKTFNIFIAFIMAIVSVSANAQSTQSIKKETVKVLGNCDMCRSRIEKAAKAAGASSATWDVDTKILLVSYNPAKATLDKIEKAVSTAGYDTEHTKASDAGYSKLPQCCQYERKAGANTQAASKSE